MMKERNYNITNEVKKVLGNNYSDLPFTEYIDPDIFKKDFLI